MVSQNILTEVLRNVAVGRHPSLWLYVLLEALFLGEARLASIISLDRSKGSYVVGIRRRGVFALKICDILLAKVWRLHPLSHREVEASL